MRLLITCFIVILAVVTCTNEPRHSRLALSARVDSVVNDTAPLHAYADSLRGLMRKATNDSQALRYLIQITEYMPAPVIRAFAEDANRLTKELNCTSCQPDALCKMGIALFKKQQYDSAAIFFRRSLSLAQQQKNGSMEAQALAWLGDYYRLTYRFDSCVYFSQRAADVALQNKDYSRAAHGLTFIGDIYRVQGITDTARMYYAQAMEYAIKANDPFRKSFILTNVAETYRLQTKFDSASIFLDSAYHIAAPLRDYVRLGFILTNMGDVSRMTGDQQKAIIHYNNAIQAAKKGGDLRREAFAYSALAELRDVLGDTAAALREASKANAIAIRINEKSLYHATLSSIGQVYAQQRKYARADSCYRLAIERCRESNNQLRLVVNLCSLADLEMQQNRPDSAIGIAQEALSVALGIEDGNEIADAYRIIGRSYHLKKDYSNAEKYLLAARDSARSYGITWLMSSAGQYLSETYAAQKKFEKAYEAETTWRKLQDSVSGNEQVRRVAQAEYAGKEAALKAEQLSKEMIARAEKAKKEEELKRQRAITTGVAGGGVLLVILLFVAYRAYRNKVHSEKIIAQQKHEVETQKVLLEERNKEVMDSITYAKRLQEAILMQPHVIEEALGESFIYYVPKDVVAGDFYWFAETDDYYFLAAADCTGHGVPGAMVSVVCSNALNRAVLEQGLTTPGMILDRVRNLVIATFERSADMVRDGMDIVLVAFPKQFESGRREIMFAGANRPLWLVRNDDLQEYKGDKQSVGNSELQQAFNTVRIAVQQGDMLYLTTDGFADQFGGDSGKKYKTAQLKEKLIALSKNVASRQQQELSNVFNNWKGNYEQLDDVTVIGVRIERG